MTTSELTIINGSMEHRLVSIAAQNIFKLPRHNKFVLARNAHAIGTDDCDSIKSKPSCSGVEGWRTKERFDQKALFSVISSKVRQQKATVCFSLETIK
mmetsp:Transcript_32421/g.39846  ORF Transcript_32421/g.39846 Transcript_32421/m.39846 type:complete len:98 (+) Transcript_32421:188-481(+)